MRILVTTTFYPPVAFGGYEVECATVVERLRRQHDVLVLTSARGTGDGEDERDVRRALPLLTPDPRGSLRAPFAALTGARLARQALGWDPDLIYVWNGSDIPHSCLRVLADSGRPMAVRVCEYWFAHIFTGDQYLRELLRRRRGPARATWAAACRGWNRRSGLRLDPTAPVRMAISYGSAALDRAVQAPPFITPVLERVLHPVPPNPRPFASLRRLPASDDIVFIGRVSPEKGLPVALRALSILRAGPVPNASLTIIGPESGGHGADLRRLARQLDLAGAVRFVGPQTAAQVAARLARAGAVIVPSVWDEPFGLVTIEAALARVPVVASDVGGIGEAMRHEEHALLFGRNDAQGAARALTRVLREPGLTAQRVQRALQRARDFDLETYLTEQEAFVAEAYAALASTAG